MELVQSFCQLRFIQRIELGRLQFGFELSRKQLNNKYFFNLLYVQGVAVYFSIWKKLNQQMSDFLKRVFRGDFFTQVINIHILNQLFNRNRLNFLQRFKTHFFQHDQWMVSVGQKRGLVCWLHLCRVTQTLASFMPGLLIFD